MLSKLLWNHKYRTHAAFIVLFFGYFIGAYLELNYNVVARDLGFIYYENVNDQIRHYEFMQFLLFVFLGIVLCGAIASGIAAYRHGKAFFVWFFLGLFANFSTLFLFQKNKAQ